MNAPSAQPLAQCLTVLFAGGGTGGHLYPGLAIAESLPTALAEAAQSTESRPIFLCSDRAIDRSILERAKVPFEVIPAKPLIARPGGLVKFALALPKAIGRARAIIRREREAGHRVIMVAMGGFVAAPCVRAARLERLPIVLVNLDAIPGKANEWIARRVDRVLTAAPVTRPGWQTIGPIVRTAARPPGTPAHCRSAFGLDPERPTLLVTGGSQGAKSLNEFLVAFVQRHAESLNGWQVIHQTGAGDTKPVETAYARETIPAAVFEFLNPIGPAWGAASLAVCRSGAGTVAEAWTSACPALFLPYPHHADMHQMANAQSLCDAGAAVIEKDLIDPTSNVTRAGQTLASLLADHDRLARMKRAAESLGPADGARTAAAAIVQHAMHAAQSSRK